MGGTMLEVSPISGAFAAQINHVDLANLSDAQFEALHQSPRPSWEVIPAVKYRAVIPNDDVPRVPFLSPYIGWQGRIRPELIE